MADNYCMTQSVMQGVAPETGGTSENRSKKFRFRITNKDQRFVILQVFAWTIFGGSLRTVIECSCVTDEIHKMNVRELPWRRLLK